MKAVYVEAKDRWGRRVWLKFTGEVIDYPSSREEIIEELDDFKPNPFTRQVWTGKKKIEVGDVEYTIISDVAYTDGEEVIE